MKKEINLFVDAALGKVHDKKSHRVLLLGFTFCFAVLFIIAIPIVVYSASNANKNSSSTSSMQVLNNSSFQSSASSVSSSSGLNSYKSNQFNLSFEYSKDFDVSEFIDDIFIQSLITPRFEIHVYKGDLKNLKSNFSSGKFVEDKNYINALELEGIIYNIRKYVRVESDIDPDSNYLRLTVYKEFYEIKYSDNVSIIYFVQNEKCLSGTKVVTEKTVPSEVLLEGMKIISSIKFN